MNKVYVVEEIEYPFEYNTDGVTRDFRAFGAYDKASAWIVERVHYLCKEGRCRMEQIKIDESFIGVSIWDFVTCGTTEIGDYKFILREVPVQ